MPNNELITQINRSSFLQFMVSYGMLWSAETKKYEHWDVWPKQRELADILDKFHIVWMMKARQLGVSEMMAMYAFFVMVREPRSEIIIISKKLPDAKYFLKKRFITKVEAALDKWGPEVRKLWPKLEHFDGRVDCENGSWIEAASSDNEEIRSHTPRLILFDEVRTFADKDAAELWSGMEPSIADQPRGQMLLASTAKPGTWWNVMTKKLINREIIGPKYFFMSFDANPKRTAKWVEKEKKKWADEKMFYREYPRNEEDCFASREGAVWPQFDTKLGGRHIKRFEINFHHRFIVAYDHGRQHPAAVLFCTYDKFADHLYIFDELHMVGLEITEIAYKFREKLNFYQKHLNAPKPQLAIADTACFAKDGRRPVADTLRSIVGINFKKSIKHDMDGSIDLVSSRFSNGQITIDPRCKNAIRQISELMWKYSDEPDKHKDEKPVDVADDHADLLRYICSELHANPRSVTTAPSTVHFNPTFNTHRRSLVAARVIAESPASEYSQDDLDAWQGLIIPLLSMAGSMYLIFNSLLQGFNYGNI